MVKKMQEDKKPVQESQKKENKIPWWWMRNDKGMQSVSVTFSAVSFIVTTLIYLGSAFEKVGSITFRPFDVSAAMTYFIPVLSLYFGRRLTDAKYNVTNKNDAV
jgi:hypothetical protein